jgi:hypothetical protein
MHTVRTMTTVAAIAALTAVGCGSSGGSKATPPASSATVSSSASPASSSSGSGTVRVDLEITGASNATIKGTKGTCSISKTMGNGYSFTGADYPDLGPEGVFALTTGTKIGDRVEPPLIKLVVGDSGYISGADVSGIQSNPEATVVNLNQGISGSTAGGPMQNVLIRGTIHCG